MSQLRRFGATILQQPEDIFFLNTNYMEIKWSIPKKFQLNCKKKKGIVYCAHTKKHCITKVFTFAFFIA